MLAHDRSGPTGRTPLLLLHAGIADRRMWDPIWPALTATHDVVRVDLRGFGESDTTPEGAWSHAEDVLATLDALGVERAHLVGCSQGAGVAAEVAVRRPSLAASLVLAAPGGALFVGKTDALRPSGTRRTRPWNAATSMPPWKRTCARGSTARARPRSRPATCARPSP